MEAHFNFKQIGAFLVIAILLVTTVILASRSVQPSTAQDFDVALVDNMTPDTKWEYKSILLAPGADQALNTEVSEFGWEFLGATSDYALFRRGVVTEQ